MSSVNDRKIRDVRDIWTGGASSRTDATTATPPPPDNKENPRDNNASDSRTRHKYKTLERHLSMKKTIRKKMMRDLREIGDACGGGADSTDANSTATAAFLEQIKNDQPAPANIDKPSLWRRLTKGWGHT